MKAHAAPVTKPPEPQSSPLDPPATAGPSEVSDVTPRILIPTQDLAPDDPALRCARLNFPEAEVHLLHVVDLLPPLDLLADVGDTALTQARDLLDALGPGEVVVADQPAGVILDRARSGAFDLIVMGTERRGRLERFFLGSVAEAVVRESPIPVLTLRAPADRLTRIRRVTLLHDFSASAERALSTVRTLWPGAAVTLLHALDPESLHTPFPVTIPEGGSAADQFIHRNQAWRQGAQRRLDALGGGEVVQGEPAELALDRARTGQTDLLALGTVSRTGVGRLLFGSVAQRVVRESPVPVLTARAAPERR